MSTALAPQGQSQQLAGLPASSLPAPVDKKALTSYLAALEDPEALELQRRLAAAYDAACKSLIGPNDVQIDGKNKDGTPREFKKKSAWRKMGRYFAITTEILTIEKEFIGEEFVATVTVRGTAPWGQALAAVGSCGTDEEEGRRRITMADAIATAETRATNRAVSNLIAMGEVSAEEIGQRDKSDRQRPEMGIEEANTIEWPWKEPEKYAGKRLGDVGEDGKPVISTLSLLRVQDWAQAKIEKGKAGRQVERLLEAVICVLGARDDLDEAQAAWDAEQAKREAKEKGAGTQASEGGEAGSQSQSESSASATPPSSAPSPEGEKSPDPTPSGTSAGSSTSAASASSSETSTTPSSTTSSTAHAEPPVQRATVQLMTSALFTMLADEVFAKNVRDKVRTRLANIELTADVLEAAIAELEAARLPF